MDFITLLDGIVIVVVLLSALLAMYRGFIREVLSIAAWVAAAAAAYLLYKPFLPTVKQYIAQEYVALGVAVTIIFVVTLMVVSYITMKISDFVLDSAFGPLQEPRAGCRWWCRSARRGSAAAAGGPAHVNARLVGGIDAAPLAPIGTQLITKPSFWPLTRASQAVMRQRITQAGG
jgi:hypothetical protein